LHDGLLKEYDLGQFGDGGLRSPEQLQHKICRKFTLPIAKRQLSELRAISEFAVGRDREPEGMPLRQCGWRATTASAAAGSEYVDRKVVTP
jgi:hypothetical protein